MVSRSGNGVRRITKVLDRRTDLVYGSKEALMFMLLVPAKQRRLAERAKPWYMQDAFNRDEEHITRFKL